MKVLVAWHGGRDHNTLKAFARILKLWRGEFVRLYLYNEEEVGFALRLSPTGPRYIVETLAVSLAALLGGYTTVTDDIFLSAIVGILGGRPKTFIRGDWPTTSYVNRYFRSGPKPALLLYKIWRTFQSLALILSSEVRTVNPKLYAEAARRGRNVKYDLSILDLSPFASCTRKGSGGQIYLYVGRLSWEKGVDRVLRWFLRRQDGELWIVGDGPLRDLVLRVSSCTDKVKYLGPYERPRLREVYERATYLVLLPYAEALSLVLLEALVCGVKVVTSAEVPIVHYLRRLRPELVEIASSEGIPMPQ